MVLIGGTLLFGPIFLAVSTVSIFERVAHVLMALHMGPQSYVPTDLLFIGVSVIASEMR